VREVRVYMERIRLTPKWMCNNIDVLYNAESRILRKALKLLSEAVDKTPPTITSRPLIESALNLLISASTLMDTIVKCNETNYI